MAARSKACVCGRSLAGIKGSIPAGGMNACLLLNVVCWQVGASATGRSLVQRSPTEWVWMSVCVCERERSGATLTLSTYSWVGGRGQNKQNGKDSRSKRRMCYHLQTARMHVTQNETVTTERQTNYLSDCTQRNEAVQNKEKEQKKINRPWR